MLFLPQGLSTGGDGEPLEGEARRPPGEFGTVFSQLEIVFDEGWYVSQLATKGIDVARETDPLHHFQEVGAPALLSPHPLFDVEWYLSQNADARAGLGCGILPFVHFMTVGESKGFWPHALFDVEWYRKTYGLGPHENALVNFLSAPISDNRSAHPHFDADWYTQLHVDPQGWDRQAIIHFILHGQDCGYKPNRWGRYDRSTKAIITDPRPYKLSRMPLVSLIIPNLNGDRFLAELMPSLKRQTYDKFELIFVDNGSTDRSVATVAEAFPAAKIVRLNTNAGFAEANNIGYRQARGELIALLNNDTTVGDDWLAAMVAKIQQDVNLGAVCPKIRFRGRFCRVLLQSKQPFGIDKRLLIDSLLYKKVFVPTGSDGNPTIESISIGAHHAIELFLPFQLEAIELKSTGEPSEHPITAFARNTRRDLQALAGAARLSLRLSRYDYDHSFFVINNAGGRQPSWLQTADIGFGHPDGADFSHGSEVDLLCGCAALIRRDALLGAELFVDDFVAYYEDSELSLRLRRSGFSIGYCPEAIVYHHHSATTIEHSPFWKRQVFRNKVLFSYILSDRVGRVEVLKTALQEFDDVQEGLGGRGQAGSHDTGLRDELVELCKGVDSGNVAVRRRPRVGIFNAFWNTLGGAEAHAMIFAAYLSRFFQVELLSINDFDVDFLGDFYNISAASLVKRLLQALTPSVTAEYDVFINSSFMDECPSQAVYSWYIVSFPSRSPSPQFLDSYKFLANSDYTRRWIDSYWGSAIDVITVKPCISSKFIAAATPGCRRERMFLSVGRFFRSGHSKKQALIAKCYLDACASYSDGHPWQLVLVGAVNDTEYLDEVRSVLAGSNHEIITNASFECLRALYARAAVYVHAAGFGCDAQAEPADFEHFGMTVAEAAASGCLPLVYDAAGPKEIVEMLGVGRTFRSEQDLVRLMVEAMAMFDVDDGMPHVDARLGERLGQLSYERLVDQLADIFSDVTSSTAEVASCW